MLGKADEISPRSIERLCLMGEVGLNLNNPVAAREMFNKALLIDSNASRPKAGLHMVEVVEGNPGNFKSGGESIATNFASVLNTVAISKIHEAEYEKGIEQYRSALTFLNTKITSSKLSFNLGLAYLKAGSLQDAYPWFIQCLQLNPEMKKAKKYVARLRKYFESKDPKASWQEIQKSFGSDSDIDWE
jgi:tetratricopeptide (TPR) repeat protein